MNFLLLVDNLTNGGGNYYLSKIGEYLARDGHEVYLCTARKPGFVAQDSSHDFPSSFHLIVRPRIPRFTKGFGLVDRMWTRIYDRYVLSRLVRRTRIDWVFGMQRTDAIRAARVGHEAGTYIGNFVFESPEYVGERLGLDPAETEKVEDEWKPFANALSRSDVVNAVSETVKQRVDRWISGVESNVVYVGIDTSIIEDIEKPEQKRQIIYIGRLEDYKNVDELIVALSKIENPPRLVICGDGNIRPDLQKLARDLSVQCDFLGWVSEETKWREIKSSLFMVFPSSFGGMPPAEALGCRVPCIAADVSFNREMYDDYVEYVPEHDVEKLADAISDLMSDSARRAEMGQEGFKYIDAKLSWRQSAAEVARIVTDYHEQSRQ